MYIGRGLLVCFLLASWAQADSVDRLTLKEAMLRALHNNPHFAELRKQYDQLAIAADEPRAAYDPSLSLVAEYSYDKSASYLSIFSSETVANNLSASYAQLFEGGWQFDATLSSNWVKPSPSAFIPLNPYVDSALSISINKPLWRGLDGREERDALEISLAGVRVAEYDLRAQRESVLYQVGLGYWNWVRATEIKRLKDESYKLARQLQDIVAGKSQRGLSERRDVLQTQALELLRKQEALTAQQEVERAWEQLQQALYENPDSRFIPDFTYQPVLSFSEFSVLLERAKSHRQDREQLLKKQRVADMQIRLYQEQLRPELNLSGGVESTGLKGDYSASLANLLTLNNPVYTVGLTYVPALSRRVEQLKLEQSIAERDRIDETLRAFDLDLAYAIRRQINSVYTLGERADTAQKLAGVQRAKLNNEIEELSIGRSSIQTVVDFQNDYVNAQMQLVQAQVDRELSRLQVLFLQHSLYESFIELQSEASAS